MLKTKSILASKESSDGIRISVMSRHTLNDGTTPDKRITKESYDEWNKNLAPPEKLVGQYYSKEITWEEFEKNYSNYLLTQENEIKKLANMAKTKDITLLCIEESPERCHRRLLAKECKKYSHFLDLDIK